MTYHGVQDATEGSYTRSVTFGDARSPAAVDAHDGSDANSASGGGASSLPGHRRLTGNRAMSMINWPEC
jgi:hypothetical protein